jgi:hypothetical protein
VLRWARRTQARYWHNRPAAAAWPSPATDDQSGAGAAVRDEDSAPTPNEPDVLDPAGFLLD